MDQNSHYAPDANNKIAIRDLSDFSEQWSANKIILQQAVAEHFPADSRSNEIVNWLILLADKVCLVEEP